MRKSKGRKGSGEMSVREAGARGGEASWGTHRGPYEKPGPDKGQAFGVAAVTQALHGVDFPVTKEELIEQAGDKEIQYRKGQAIKLARLLRDFEDEEFPTMAEVVEAVSAAAKQEGLSGNK